MGNWSGSTFSWKFALVLCGVVCTAYYFLVLERTNVDLKIVSKTQTTFKIYWAKAGQDYSENRMVEVRVGKGREQYYFSMPSLKNIEKLRIDTHDFKGAVGLKHLQLTQPGHVPLRLAGSSAIERMQPLGQVESFTLVEKGVRIASAGHDPNFEVILRQEESQAANPLKEMSRMALLCLLTLLVYAVLGRLACGFAYVPVCLAVVLIMVVIMAVISRKNVHPDEFVHVAAVEYYKSNWQPPKIFDEEVRNTYSPYGVSRLNGDEIYYLIAGKFAFAFERMFQNPFTACRMFNVLLLLGIILYLVQLPQARVMALPLLISPQIWYLYSYCNSDAFALTIIFFTSCQVVLPDSMLRRYFEQSAMPGWLIHGLTVGVLLACLLLLKKNFVIYTGFFALVAFVTFYQLVNEVHPDERKVLYTKLVALMLVSISLYGGKKFVDYQVNGPDKGILVSEAIAAYAKPRMHPDTAIDKRLPSMMLRERGVSLKSIIVDYRWPERTFRSSFGYYGYLNTPASDVVYNVFRGSVIILALYFFGVIFVQGTTLNKRYAGSALALGGMLVCIAVYHSWINDFQAQGRYLFPIVGMLCILCGQNVKHFSERWLSLLVVWMFCLSSYSYITVALLKLPKNSLL